MKAVLPPLAVAFLIAALGAQPAGGAALSGSLDAKSVVDKMAQRNPSLQNYQARVHVDIRVLSFPFLAPKLDGTSYYQRPDTYVVVFDRMPSYAKSFGRLFNEVGNPLAWERDENITVEGSTLLGGRDTIVLRLTKKIHSDVLDRTLVYVDSASYAIERMEWYYTNGGKITMSQQYRLQGIYSVLSQQHATITIPYVRAVADAVYGTYQTNVSNPTAGARAQQ